MSGEMITWQHHGNDLRLNFQGGDRENTVVFATVTAQTLPALLVGLRQVFGLTFSYPEPKKLFDISLGEVGFPFKFRYTNYRGSTDIRSVQVYELFYGTEPPWYIEPQWLLKGYDQEKKEVRTFALDKIKLPANLE